MAGVALMKIVEHNSNIWIYQCVRLVFCTLIISLDACIGRGDKGLYGVKWNYILRCDLKVH